MKHKQICELHKFTLFLAVSVNMKENEEKSIKTTEYKTNYKTEYVQYEKTESQQYYW